MKTIKKILIILMITLITCATMKVYATSKGKVTQDTNLRKEMKNKSTILEVIPKNDEFEILEDQGDWYKVNYKKIKGYIKKDNVEVTKKDEEEKQENTQSEDTKTDGDNAEKNIANPAEGSNTVDEQKQEESIKVGDHVYAKIEQSLMIRPLINSIKLQSVAANQEVIVMEIVNGWAYVTINNTFGWVREDNLTSTKPEAPKKEESKQTNKTMYVSVENLNFRKKASNESTVIDTLTQNEKVTVISDDGTWCKVKYDGKEGYILKKYLSENKVKQTTSRSSTTRKEEATKNQTKTENTIAKKTNEATSVAKPNTSKASQVVSIAKKYLGSRYVYGGASPSGFDCSGFVMYVYKQIGISLPRTSTAQSKVGTAVSKANLQPGDIVCFSNYRTGKGIGHSGIYIGNGQFIHASTEKTGVITSSINGGSHAKRFVTARRVL